jgi:hypothetical protein
LSSWGHACLGGTFGALFVGACIGRIHGVARADWLARRECIAADVAASLLEGWLRFFLRGVAETAGEATSTAQRILELREQHRARVLSEDLGPNALKLLSVLFASPIVNVNLVSSRIGVTFATANKLIGRFEELGLVREITGQRRSRRFRYDPYLRLFHTGISDAGTEAPAQVTTGG